MRASKIILNAYGCQSHVLDMHVIGLAGLRHVGRGCDLRVGGDLALPLASTSNISRILRADFQSVDYHIVASIQVPYVYQNPNLNHNFYRGVGPESSLAYMYVFPR